MVEKNYGIRAISRIKFGITNRECLSYESINICIRLMQGGRLCHVNVKELHHGSYVIERYWYGTKILLGFGLIMSGRRMLTLCGDSRVGLVCREVLHFLFWLGFGGMDACGSASGCMQQDFHERVTFKDQEICYLS